MRRFPSPGDLTLPPGGGLTVRIHARPKETPMATVSFTQRDRKPSRTRDIGPIGTTSRVLVGVTALAVPIALEGLSWWDMGAMVVAALVLAPAARLTLLGFERYAPFARVRDLGACSPVACSLLALLFGLSVAAGVATPANGDVVL